jgi:hypothetical protein
VRSRATEWQNAAVAVGATIALGAVLAWSPWKGDDRALPDGVELGDCDSTAHQTLTVSASEVSFGDRPPVGAVVPRVVLSAPVFPDSGEVAQVGSEVTVPVQACDTLSIDVSWDPMEVNGLIGPSVPVVEQRLDVGEGSVFVSDPLRLPCEDTGSCAVWSGWFLTVESLGEGTAGFTTSVGWLAPDGSVEFQGQFDVEVRLDGAG